jgi:hypothetical protein
MAPSCTVCIHEELSAINLDIIQKVPHRDIAAHYGVSASAVQRHSISHLNDNTMRSLAIRGEANDLVDQGIATDAKMIYALLAENFATARSIQQRAIDSDDPNLTLKALKEARDSLALLQKFTVRSGIEIQGDPELEEDMRQLIIAMKRVFPIHREAGKALVRELEMLGAIGTAYEIKKALMIDGELV